MVAAGGSQCLVSGCNRFRRHDGPHRHVGLSGRVLVRWWGSLNRWQVLRNTMAPHRPEDWDREAGLGARWR